jgi:hypothetical protein
MSVVHYLRRAASMPPRQFAARARQHIGRRIGAYQQRRCDFAEPTFATDTLIPPGPLLRYFTPPGLELLGRRAELISRLAGLGVEHRFDLLGSGWVEVFHGMPCAGLEGHCYPPGEMAGVDQNGHWLESRINRSNQEQAQAAWRLVEESYVPIDWHLDFKSGYRWDEATWYREIRYGHASGADVKVPWELARMQHLPQLAWAWALSVPGDAGFLPADAYLREFRNQVLDFIATNPPRFGVNWCCTMDVGIRVANWLVAYDLFRAFGAEFDQAFTAIFHRSVYEHGLHIVTNLEWNAALRSNHYLADIAGLLFVAAFLPCTKQTDGWLEFAVRELVHETELQFGDDGANFEASTSYHRLSAEMVFYATALVLALPDEKQDVLRTGQIGGGLFHGDPQAPPLQLLRLEESDRETPFSARYFERLERMAEFTVALTRPDGTIAQIGDNDSGRFLKLSPTFQIANDANFPLREIGRDHRHLAAAANGFWNRDEFGEIAADNAIETTLIRDLIGCEPVPSYHKRCSHPGAEKRIRSQPSRANQEHVHVFRDFGLVVFRRGLLHLTFRAGGVGQDGNGGHAHNDQLSFELSVGRHAVIVDPGTYLYTPIPSERNHFRATARHNTLSMPGREQNRWVEGPLGLFSLPDRGKARICDWTDDEIVAEHVGFGSVCRRRLQINEQGVYGVDEYRSGAEKAICFHLAPGVVADWCDGSIALDVGDASLRLKSADGTWSIEPDGFSPGYGEHVATETCCLKSAGTSIAWKLEVCK